jgi:putative endonuclease
MARDHRYFVYIMTNRSKNFYVGITSELFHRSNQHKNGTYEGFTSRYKLDRLAYYEVFGLVHDAIAREKQIKRWRRKKKIDLIIAMNPTWRDLSDDWGKPIEPLLGQTEKLLAAAARLKSKTNT